MNAVSSMDGSDAIAHAYPTRSIVSRDDWLAATPSLINDDAARPTPSIFDRDIAQPTPSIVLRQGDHPTLSEPDFKPPSGPLKKSLSRQNDPFDIDLGFLNYAIEDILSKMTGGNKSDHTLDKPDDVRSWELNMSKIWQTAPILPEWVSHPPHIRHGVPREFEESQIMFQRACFPKGSLCAGTLPFMAWTKLATWLSS
jgi:hypothetical protein